jgi:hypothetical protein
VNGTILSVPLQDEDRWSFYVSWILLDRDRIIDATNDVVEKNIICG